jgi:uncharacterized membrane protein YhaH (DUF805 family)
MGPMPSLNFAPRWAAVRAAVTGMDVARLKASAHQVFTLAKTAVAKIDAKRIKSAAHEALNAAKTTAATSWPILREIADPRGRCNRKGFLTIALAFLAVQFAVAGLFWLFGIETDNTTNLLLNAPILWIGSTVCFKRLHDVGLSGWWLPGAFVIWFVTVLVSLALISIALADDALDPGQMAFYVAFVAITLPVFGALLWLHTAPSVETANKYGPIAGPMGLSMPERKAAAATDAPSAPDAPSANVATAA